MGVAYVVANTIPFFDVFVELLGSTFESWFALGLPVVFYLVFLDKESITVSSTFRYFLYFCLFYATVVTILGTGTTIKDFLDHSSEAPPFDCACDSKSCVEG